MDPSPKRQKTEENDKTDLTVEDTCTILESFTREQLLEVAQEAATKHPNVLDLVRSIADQNPAQGKLFVRGLHWNTNTESLRAIFSQFGELEEGSVIMDKNTGRSKDYGFVTFKHIDGALNSIEEPIKEIDGRMTVTSLASAGSQQRADPSDRRTHQSNGSNHHCLRNPNPNGTIIQGPQSVINGYAGLGTYGVPQFGGLRYPNPSVVHPGRHLNNQEHMNSSTFSSTTPIRHGPQSGFNGYQGLGTYGFPQVGDFAGSEATGGNGSMYGVHPTSGDGPHPQSR